MDGAQRSCCSSQSIGISVELYITTGHDQVVICPPESEENCDNDKYDGQSPDGYCTRFLKICEATGLLVVRGDQKMKTGQKRNGSHFTADFSDRQHGFQPDGGICRSEYSLWHHRDITSILTAVFTVHHRLLSMLCATPRSTPTDEFFSNTKKRGHLYEKQATSGRCEQSAASWNRKRR